MKPGFTHYKEREPCRDTLTPPIGALPAGTGRTMRFTGVTVLKVENGLITEEIGLDDGVTVLEQLKLIVPA